LATEFLRWCVTPRDIWNQKFAIPFSEIHLITTRRNWFFSHIFLPYFANSIQWPEIFNNDATPTSALLDRLLHHTETIVIEGQSYRMKGTFEK
jgi:DNA replication protein DnaC